MRPIQAPAAKCELLATRPRHGRRAFRLSRESVSSHTSAAANVQELADGFIAEYDLAGIKLDPLVKRQLRDWYAAELQRAATAAEAPGGAAAPTGDGPASKDLPPLPRRRQGKPQLTVLWDVESIKPFTQLNLSSGPSTGDDQDQDQQQQRARSGPSGGRASRLAAAGLKGGGSTPDLVRALEQLCRTLQHYGNVHAVHLFLRESTLGKAPLLRRQVEQLRTWVDPWVAAEEEEDMGEGNELMGSGAPTPPRLGTAGPWAAAEQDAAAVRSSTNTTTTVSGIRSKSSDGASGRRAAGAGGARRRVPAGLPASDGNMHDCPLCRSAHPSRLALLRHFTAAHQGPLLAATATDPRTLIMWTRGRPVGLPAAVAAAPGDPRVGAAGLAGGESENEDFAPPAVEKVMIHPEEFAYARELLMQGRHLEELLAAGPVAVHSCDPGAGPGTPPAVAGANQGLPGPAASCNGQEPVVGAVRDARSVTGSSGRALGAGAGAAAGWSRRGVHLHLVPPGQRAEAASEVMRRVAKALAAEQASSSVSQQRGGGRQPQPGRGRKGGRGRSWAEEEEQEEQGAPATCVCLVSDAEGLDETLADLRQRGMLAVAVTRVSRATAADASLRWWAVQGDIEELMLKETKVWGDKGITEDLVRSLHDPCPPSEVRVHACVKSQRILIKNGTVYVTNLMPVNGFGAIELIGFLVELYEASQVFQLPDVEFSYWHDDNAPAESSRNDKGWAWPYPPHGLPPLLAWSKAKQHGALLVPYSGAFRCPRDSFDSMLASVQRMSETPWQERVPIAFGRWNIFCAWYYRGLHLMQNGQPSPCPREHYSDLYYKHPDALLTCALNRNLTNGQVAEPVGLHDQNKYKYIVSTDGWSISSKFDKYLLLGSLVLKAEGLTYGFYYPAIKPFEHYVPIMLKHEDDILEMLDWAKQNDAKAHRIATNAQRFAMRNLNRHARLCYIFRLLTELAKNMRYEVDCSRRPVCVPLVEEVKFLARHEATASKCRYHEVLSQYAHDDPDGRPGDSGYEELRRAHEAVPHHILFGGRR